MGYNTEFFGEFRIRGGKLSQEQIQYLKTFAHCRHMKRDVNLIPNDDLVEASRIKVGLPIGEEGEFVLNENDKEHFGQFKDKSVIDVNVPPKSQPGIWCKWTCNDDGTTIKYSGREKFYDATKWLKYIISKFIKRWGLSLDGKVYYECKDFNDYGRISVVDNKVTVKRLFEIYSDTEDDEIV